MMPNLGAMEVPKAYLKRQVTFSAAHRLHSKKLNEEENRDLYGPCNNPNGHGHNYVVVITVAGPVNFDTGMVMNLTDLKRYMQLAIMDVLDHKNLDMDVGYFKDRPSTVENLTLYVWNAMLELMDKPELLYEVQIHETDKNVAVYRGEMM